MELGQLISIYGIEIVAIIFGTLMLVNWGLKDNKGFGKRDTKNVIGVVGVIVVAVAFLSAIGAFGAKETIASIDPGATGGNNPIGGDTGTTYKPYNFNIEWANNYGVTYFDRNYNRAVSSSTINYTADSIVPGFIEPQFTIQRTDTFSSQDDDAVIQAQVLKVGTFQDASGTVHNFVSKDADLRPQITWEDSSGNVVCRGTDTCSYRVNRGSSVVGFFNITLTVVGADSVSFVQYRDYAVAEVMFSHPGGWQFIETVWITATTINS